MKKLAKILRFSIGVLIVLLAYAALIFFIRYIWDEVVFRNIILIILSFGLYFISLIYGDDDDSTISLLLLISTIAMVLFTTFNLFLQLINW
ncbi:hypothetical protein FPK38_15105 [Acinetobacter baumannii]|uniref:Uncharacterized protein n=8 Tax=Acinetobacter baumannii TaxID=470 RepID=A0ABD5DPJ2_ACIBA|nr:hypothetical protein M3Q_pABCC7 [Acinetobacter baumannii TYTH-1]AMC17821.1 hypothetical protein AXA63_20140 [Acinetobacter baumannii]OCY57183.1 hypothetical protein BFR79_06500 [Acinetobacter pittii]AOX75613.1 hypothetical protein KAB02_03946 [Acinetobacter baumannii]AOX79398.1 hypothetical protein KAB03_03839 [Acinetobacter baumannii]